MYNLVHFRLTYRHRQSRRYSRNTTLPNLKITRQKVFNRYMNWFSSIQNAIDT